MRSDRNPYFLLKKSRDPRVQHYLRSAEMMTVKEIESLSIKPDLKRAMLFVHHLGQQSKSKHTAELIADRMTNVQSSSDVTQYQLWRFEQDFTAATSHKTSLTVTGPFVFLKHNNQAFVAHVWVDLSLQHNNELIEKGHVIGMADRSQYNQITQQLIQQRHNLC